MNYCDCDCEGCQRHHAGVSTEAVHGVPETVRWLPGGTSVRLVPVRPNADFSAFCSELARWSEAHRARLFHVDDEGELLLSERRRLVAEFRAMIGRHGLGLEPGSELLLVWDAAQQTIAFESGGSAAGEASATVSDLTETIVWVPVEERLPEQAGLILVAWEDGDRLGTSEADFSWGALGRHYYWCIHGVRYRAGVRYWAEKPKGPR